MWLDFYKLEKLMNFEAVYYKLPAEEKFRLFKLTKDEFDREMKMKISEYQIDRYGQLV